MGCKNYQETLMKVDQMWKNEDFIDAVLDLAKKCSPNEEKSLHGGWKIIKEIFTYYIDYKGI